jgi:hypothetical protein
VKHDFDVMHKLLRQFRTVFRWTASFSSPAFTLLDDAFEQGDQKVHERVVAGGDMGEREVEARWVAAANLYC